MILLSWILDLVSEHLGPDEAWILLMVQGLVCLLCFLGMLLVLSVPGAAHLVEGLVKMELPSGL